MFSADSPNPDSMRLKSSLDVCRRTFQDMGKMTPLGKNIVMRPLSQVRDATPVRSIVCFGDAGQLRDLCTMVHYGESCVYSPIMAPGGSGLRDLCGLSFGDGR